jgi:hypothetical protein
MFYDVETRMLIAREHVELLRAEAVAASKRRPEHEDDDLVKRVRRLWIPSIGSARPAPVRTR